MTVTTNRTIKGRNPKATWGVKIGGVILHCNLVVKTGNGQIGKGASLFYAMDSQVKFWIPNCVIFRCKDAIPLDGHYRVIVNIDWLIKKKWNITMIREDNTTFTRCFNPEKSSVKSAYDDITMQDQQRAEALAEDYGLHLELAEQDAKTINDLHAAAEYYEVDPREELFTWIAEGTPTE